MAHKGKSGRIALAAAAALLGLGLPGEPASARDSRFAPLPDPVEVDPAKAALGKMLFFDARLSGDDSTACATCHDPARGWGDAQPMSRGYTGVEYFRNAPGLFNAAHRNYFMWDARLDGEDLATLARDMITESHTMNMDSRLAQERLKQVPEYLEMFEAAYGAEPYGGRIYGAIAEYLKTIRTRNAPFDAYLRGEEGALPDSARRGMELFAGKAECIACHSGPMLSDGALHATGVPDHPELAESAGRQIAMLRFYATMGTPNYMNLREDVGNYAVTKDEADWGAFATPSLWDVGQTAPYMHSGAFGTLPEVVAFYDEAMSLGLSGRERGDLAAFLESLTGEAPGVEPPELPEYGLRAVGEN